MVLALLCDLRCETTTEKQNVHFADVEIQYVKLIIQINEGERKNHIHINKYEWTARRHVGRGAS